MDDWKFYQDALAGKKPEAREGDVHVGFYRTRRYDPVAFWKADGKMVAVRAGKAVADPHDMADLFMQVSAFPIDYELYKDVAAGKPWPHDAAPVTKPVTETVTVASTTLSPNNDDVAPSVTDAGIGHNKPPEGFELFKQDVEIWLATAKTKTAAPGTETEADSYANLAKKLQTLENEANAQYDVERKPHSDALEKVRRQWLPLINSVEAGKKKIKSLVGEWQKAETARRQAVVDSLPPGAVTAAKVSSGTLGRIVLREHRSAKIVDFDKAMAFFKSHPRMRELVQSLADQCAASEARVLADGCEMVTEQRAA